MSSIILSQARRIANGDPDIVQNILACNIVNHQNAKLRGKKLSIGEQVNFMKHRAGEFRSGVRNEFGNTGHTTKDALSKRLYYEGEVEVHSIQYEEEQSQCGKGMLTAYMSNKNAEDSYIFRMDLESFLFILSKQERLIFIMRLNGYKQIEIANVMKLSVSMVRRTLSCIGRKYVHWFDIEQGR